MTTAKDTLEKRLKSPAWGPGKEATVGVARDGFSDPTGEFPRRDYYYGSSINKGARGLGKPSVSVAGSVPGVDIDLPEAIPSQYPLCQVNETASGHVIVIDDTPGNESVMVLHRSGAGVEFLPDGTLVVNSRSKRIEVTGGDHRVIVEGSGDMTYHGNLNLNVSGDYNVNVSGNYKVNVAGNEVVDVLGSSRSRVGKTFSKTILGDMDERVVGHRASLTLGNDVLAVKGERLVLVEGRVEISTGSRLEMSAKDRFSLAAANGMVVAGKLAVMGATGTIGGEKMEHYGNVFGGPAGGLGTETTFYGTLAGVATEAVVARFAQKADEAHSAYHANAAAIAGVAGNDNGVAYGAFPGPKTMSGIIADPTFPMMHIDFFTANPFTTAMPDLAGVGGILGMSELGIKNVQVDPDDDLVNKLSRINDYNGKFSRPPSTPEVRAVMRDVRNLTDTTLTTTLVAEGKLNPEYTRITPKGVKRIVGKTPGAVFGYTPIGNNPLDSRSKRIIPKR